MYKMQFRTLASKSDTLFSIYWRPTLIARRRYTRVRHIVWYRHGTKESGISAAMPRTRLSICWSQETFSTGVAAGPSLVTSSWRIAWERKSGGGEWEMNICFATGGGWSGPKLGWTPVISSQGCLNQLYRLWPLKRVDKKYILWKYLH